MRAVPALPTSRQGVQHTKNKLSGNSASAYFNAFFSIVHFAYRDNILSEDYTACVEKIKWNHDIPKEYLLSAEIKQLASTPYDDNPDVYGAGMFSIYTGLRRSDILALRWKNIHHDCGRKAYIRFRIKKTSTWIQLQVSSTQNYAKISSKKMIEAIIKME